MSRRGRTILPADGRSICDPWVGRRQLLQALSALVAEIDVLRIAADDPPNLASALRSWLFEQALTIAAAACDREPMGE